MKEWGCKPFQEITKSPRPIQPVAVWNRSTETNDITITLPNQKEVT